MLNVNNQKGFIPTGCGVRNVAAEARNGDAFEARHIGVTSAADTARMLATVSEAAKRSLPALDDLTRFVIPQDIQARAAAMPAAGNGKGEHEALAELRALAEQNTAHRYRTFIGEGFYGCVAPSVITRNVLEDPSWYTPYTPYQAEVAQGRLEAMLAYQTVVSDLTGLPVATCSLLDEGTAAAEAMRMCVAHKHGAGAVGRGATIAVASTLHRHVIDVVRTRAAPLGVRVVEVDPRTFDPAALPGFVGLIAGYPNTLGTVDDLRPVADRVHRAGGLFVCDCDLLALTLLREPAAFGADVVVGTSARLGCGMGFGGAHAAFLATSDRLKRIMPGRIIGVTRDKAGNKAYRMALGTREQHIRRERATSNICTASALMCQIAAFYCMYHGPRGLARIASLVHQRAARAAAMLAAAGFDVLPGTFFDTVVVRTPSAADARRIVDTARADHKINLRLIEAGPAGSAVHTAVAFSLDETACDQDVADIFDAFVKGAGKGSVEIAKGRAAGCAAAAGCAKECATQAIPEEFKRKTAYLTHKTFNSYYSETEMMRHIKHLSNKDLGLNQRMTPLGSCTMKLNPAACMRPILWPEFANVHPFVPAEQVRGYHALIAQLERMLCDVTGFDACSLQPLSGASGEYCGLLTVRNYLRARDGNHKRNVCLLPVSAHGTNPASAAMAGFKTVAVKCDARGNIDLADLRAKAERHAAELACVMMTYPSTHGVFEETFREAAAIVHRLGGCVYMDGANMNAQVGLIKPGEIGADVCHLNLHKTFAMPHGGGGSGVGPVCVTRALAPYLPGHSAVAAGTVAPTAGCARDAKGTAVSSAPYGNPDLLPISWMYIRMLGQHGLRRATQTAILNANYMAARLRKHYDLVFTGPAGGTVGHEFILDLRHFGHSAGVEAVDVAKRLIDYGFHAPTLSFPVGNTLMVEPTESESLAELDRFCDALIAIRKEIAAIERGELDRHDNPLKNAPHTALEVTSDAWKHKYSRRMAAYPLPVVEKDKFWPSVKRVDDVYGDLHLVTRLV